MGTLYVCIYYLHYKTHLDPVVDVDVGEAVADDVVEEGEVEEAALDPVLGRVREYDVQARHQEYVARQEDQEGVVGPIKVERYNLTHQVGGCILLTLVSAGPAPNLEEFAWQSGNPYQYQQNIVNELMGHSVQ